LGSTGKSRRDKSSQTKLKQDVRKAGLRTGDRAERYYSQAGADRDDLSASEYVAVVEDFLREFVCMGQCDPYIAAAKDPKIKEATEVYLDDVH
jgi:hypothetical protein